ncbi:sulfurtransferase [Bacillus sp. FJAT-50079]|uniref:sulfurtransferase n=1 Tax=Bacillus sp. FJAT-50079 TaxID=2833577 RepID=UPI001BC9B0E9|nr:sulfurtransferase [Bacillus sp. FJAT-50079]MBS4209820.1 sulfurtransferase [Bacillus sp. FJAT-50079]
MQFIKSSEWLVNNITSKEIRVVDCRYALDNPLYGKHAYEAEHIPGSVYFDLGEDLSGPVEAHGGRHPLPNMDVFREQLELAAINEEVTVIAYDDGEGAFASRFWWMLRYSGHRSVYVLDGGFTEWKQAGYSTAKEIPTYERTTFHMDRQTQMLATYEEVKESSADQQAILLDSRARSRYLGLEEPIDAKPGHIPNAVNREWTDGFANGRWKDKQEQEKRFKDFKKSDEIIVYCGSGVTATPNIIALLEAGFEHVKLYAGSYSDWVSYSENEVELGE